MNLARLQRKTHKIIHYHAKTGLVMESSKMESVDTMKLWDDPLQSFFLLDVMNGRETIKPEKMSDLVDYIISMYILVDWLTSEELVSQLQMRLRFLGACSRVTCFCQLPSMEKLTMKLKESMAYLPVEIGEEDKSISELSGFHVLFGMWSQDCFEVLLSNRFSTVDLHSEMKKLACLLLLEVTKFANYILEYFDTLGARPEKSVQSLLSSFLSVLENDFILEKFESDLRYKIESSMTVIRNHFDRKD